MRESHDTYYYYYYHHKIKGWICTRGREVHRNFWSENLEKRLLGNFMRRREDNIKRDLKWARERGPSSFC
jgi:hypothetical protein